ncbi:MAG: hypothetical protein Q9161_001231 [Pseudevernia consocians]
MKLRSGVHVAQVPNGGIAQSPKTFQAIAEHNASSLLLMLPQEVKNRIYHFVCGGHMVHILQNDQNHVHVHGDDSVELSHATCIEPLSEEQVQNEFDSADLDVVAWNIAAAEDRHEVCHGPPPTQKDGHKPNQLSLTFLRSCRQIYLEANMVPYTDNTFAINCNDTLERFARVRFQNKQNLAIRSLCLSISVKHKCSVDIWTYSINKAVLKRLKCVRRLYLNLGQIYCGCCIDVCGYEGSEMTERQGNMFKMFRKLPLNEVTLVIDDSMFMVGVNPHHYHRMEQRYRWTMKQKQDFSKDVRGALLARGGVQEGDGLGESA